jgi:hypothetical protein
MAQRELQEWNVCIRPASGRLGLLTRVVLWVGRSAYEMRVHPGGWVAIALDRESAGRVVTLLEESHGGASGSPSQELKQHVVRVLGERLTRTDPSPSRHHPEEAEHDRMFPEHVLSFLSSRRAASVLARVLRVLVGSDRVDLLDPQQHLVFFLDRASALMMRDLLITEDAHLRHEEFRWLLVDDMREWLSPGEAEDEERAELPIPVDPRVPDAGP